MFRWVIEGRVATGPRPGFAGKVVRQVTRSEVDDWIQEAKRRYGIRSVICLLRRSQLRLHAEIPGGLITSYRARGLTAEHFPIRSGQSPALSQQERKRIWKAFKELRPPVLIHCSAGKTRSRAAAAYIKKKLGAHPETQ